ncbi:MAG: MmcQ/YjbR family DNA-binding protein [Rhodanobacteraceae bacterium]
MTQDGFRRLALALPEAVESAHMAHPDFRVGGKIFATLGYPDAEWGMVKLAPEQQELFMRVAPGVFVPAKGAWGKSGSTTVLLKKVSVAVLRDALTAAWRNVAPKRLGATIE